MTTQGSRIALIDDDSNWIESFAEFLQRKGFYVGTASDGLAGLRLFQRNGFVAAVVDYHMPGLNGLEFLRELRRQHQNVPVLLVSGENDPTLAQRARKEGAEAFFPKTTSPRVLLESVKRSIQMQINNLGDN